MVETPTQGSARVPHDHPQLAMHCLVFPMADVHQGIACTLFTPGILPSLDTRDREREAHSPAWPARRLRGLRVLLVDDSLEVLEVMTMLLETEEALVSAYSDATQALARAQDQQATFDLIISDIGMPKMDGYKLIAGLRQLPACASLPAIALTGYGGNQDIDQALRAGFNQHLSKPVSYERLITAIQKLVSDKTEQ